MKQASRKRRWLSRREREKIRFTFHVNRLNKFYFLNMIFQGPDKEKVPYASKFLRVGEAFYVTAPGDENTRHESLAWGHNVTDEVRRLKG